MAKQKLQIDNTYKYWKMKSGEEIRIDLMDDSHLINSVKMIHRAIKEMRMIDEELSFDISDYEVLTMMADDRRIQEYDDLMEEVKKRCLTHCL